MGFLAIFLFTLTSTVGKALIFGKIFEIVGTDLTTAPDREKTFLQISFNSQSHAVPAADIINPPTRYKIEG